MTFPRFKRMHVYFILLIGGAFLLGLSFYFRSCRQSCSADLLVSVPPLRVLYSEWPPDMMVFLAQRKGFFLSHQVPVQLVWVNGFEEAQKKRKKGDVDIWNYTLLDFVTDYATGVEREAQVFFLEDFSFGADALVTLDSSPVQTVAQLKAKKVGAEQGTVGEFFLNIALHREDLGLEDLRMVNVAAADVPRMLQEGVIDAGMTYEPYVTQAISSGGRVILDSSQERGVIVDVYVAKHADLQQNPERYRRFMQAVLEAGQYFKEHPQEAIQIIRDPLRMSDEEVSDVFEKLRIPDFRDNQVAFDRTSGFSSLYNLVRSAQQYLEEQGIMTDDSSDLDFLINPQFIDFLFRA